jgi:TATA-binding protein-associated factor
LEALHKQVLPFLLRRLKEDVLSDLPPKIIQDYYCDLSPIQSVLYDEFAKSRAAEEAGEEVETSSEAPAPAGQGHVFQSLQYLRKLCNHPALVLGGEGQDRWDELKRRAGLSKDVGLRDLGNAPKLEALK